MGSFRALSSRARAGGDWIGAGWFDELDIVFSASPSDIEGAGCTREGREEGESDPSGASSPCWGPGPHQAKGCSVPAWYPGVHAP